MPRKKQRIQVPAALLPRLEAINEPIMRWLAATILSKTFEHGEFPTHSAIVSRFLFAQHAARFYDYMKTFNDVIRRDGSYLAKHSAGTRAPFCKTWIWIEPEPQPEPTETRYASRRHRKRNRLGKTLSKTYTQGPLVADFLLREGGKKEKEIETRLAENFDWFFDVYLPGKSILDPQTKKKLEKDLARFQPPSDEELQERGITLNASDQRHVEKLRTEERQPTTEDEHSRINHDLTRFNKQVRPLSTLDGEPVAEVDIHASFVASIAAVYAEGEEKERLGELLAGGDFYKVFAAEAGVSTADAKHSFMQDVIFSRWRPNNTLWEAFRRMFPMTARRLAGDRDQPDPNPRVKVTKDKRGYKRTKTTTRGQTLLFRRLCYVESLIVWRGALPELQKMGIPAIPVHDCLIVPCSRVREAKAAMERFARQVLGFDVKIKTKGAA